MVDHYYSRNPQAKSSPQTWQTDLLGETYTFTTDGGVFSQNKVDFGTKVLIESFTEPSIQGSFLDLGCGYGPIGISLATKFPNRDVVMVDVNARAIELAKDNTKENSVKNTEVLYSDGFSALKDKQFASIITNPPIRAGKKIIYEMFDNSKDALKQKGTLWVVIQKKQGAPSARKKLAETFTSVDIITRKKGYYVMCAYNT